MQIGGGQMLFGDCLDVMKGIPDGSVDMVLCDLPYGTTQNKWDTIIPFEPLWAHYWRVCKPNAAVVLTAAQPFASALVMSAVREFKYSWVWDKAQITGFLNAKKQPLRRHEDVAVFYRSQPTYNPIFTEGKAYKIDRQHATNNYGAQTPHTTDSDGRRYPTSILSIPIARQLGGHPTQKPVALFEYLIRTYTQPGEIVLDNCSGSGTTAVAAINSDRQFICIEQDVDYYLRSLDRVRERLGVAA